MKNDELLKVYRTFWHEFVTICRGGGATAKPSDGSLIQIDNDSSNTKQVVVETFSYFPDWRYKAASASERVHIIAKSRETYSRAESHILESKVQVLYAKVSGKDARSLLALHYDFDSPVQPAHPVFHAQFGVTDFPTDKLHKIGFRATIKAPPSDTLYSTVRIPTPCMNFGSVLLGLAADHLQSNIFNQILKLVRGSGLVEWAALCDSLQTSLRAGSYLPSHHWYENAKP